MKIEAEKTKSLPIGWKVTNLGAVLYLKNGFAFKSNSYQGNGTPVIRISDIQDGVVTTKSSIRIKASEEFNNYLVHKSDILIAMSGATTGKYGIYNQKELAYQNQRVGNFRLYSDDLINKKFIFFLLGSLKREIERKAYGGAQPNISGKNIERLKFNLPPLPEQHRIVAKIEELFSELDNGIESLKKAREQLKTYRQAVLKYAFEGKLTKEWRTLQRQAGNPPEPAEKLLEQIKAEREKHYQKQIVKWKQAVTEWKANGEKGKKPKRISMPKTLSKLPSEETEIYGELPTSWRWSTFCNVTYKVGDIDHKMPKDFTGGLPYLSTGNLKKDGTIDFTNAKTISKEDFKRLSLKIKPERGDIIFPRYGTIGRNILINFNKEFLVSYSCAIIKNIPSLMDGKFVYYYSLSPVIKKEIEKYTVQTTQANIGIASIENFVFPLCSLPEQQAIVSEIDSRLSVCDKIEQTVEDSLEKAEALRQSVLKKAFAGELTRDWREKHPEFITGENSAEKLLEKIKAEKALTAGRGKPRSRKTKKK